MNPSHEVISAFLDDEPFAPQALSAALADPQGRALLLDLIALRHLAQPDEGTNASVPAGRPWLRRLIAAAAVVVAVSGGYLWGQRTGTDATPPEPTHVVKVSSEWRDAGGQP
jgi:hypothetical protein